MIFRPDSASLWLRPHWLRPTALVAGTAINVTVALLVNYAHLRKPPPLPVIEVTILPKEIAPKATAPKPPAIPKPQPKPQPPPPPPPPPKPAKPPPPPPKPPKPPSPKPAKPPPPAPKPPPPKPPDVKPAPKPPEKALREKQEKLRRLKEAQEKRRIERAAKRKAAQERAEMEKARRERARAASGRSRAAYASIVVREIQRLKYLGARRAGGATGRVSVTFTVGRSGRIVSHRVHSANPRLAGAVAAMMRAFHAPPPPGGRFSASTNINFAR